MHTSRAYLGLPPCCLVCHGSEQGQMMPHVHASARLVSGSLVLTALRAVLRWAAQAWQTLCLRLHSIMPSWLLLHCLNPSSNCCSADRTQRS